jgi:hypothetical protein
MMTATQRGNLRDGMTCQRTSTLYSKNSLFRTWGDLKTLLEVNREFLVWREQVRRDLTTWTSAHEDEELLYRGARLATAFELRKRDENELTDRERRFLNTSVALQERQDLEAENRCNKELEESRRLASAQRRASNFLLLVVAVPVVGTSDPVPEPTRPCCAVTRQTHLRPKRRGECIAYRSCGYARR